MQIDDEMIQAGAAAIAAEEGEDYDFLDDEQANRYMRLARACLMAVLL